MSDGEKLSTTHYRFEDNFIYMAAVVNLLLGNLNIVNQEMPENEPT